MYYIGSALPKGDGFIIFPVELIIKQHKQPISENTCSVEAYYLIRGHNIY
jgi:hypothetical protein